MRGEGKERAEDKRVRHENVTGKREKGEGKMREVSIYFCV
jgi:hypothetical protein